MENPIKMDDLGVPLFLETPILLQYYIILIQYYINDASVLSSQPVIFSVFGIHP